MTAHAGAPEPQYYSYTASAGFYRLDGIFPRFFSTDGCRGWYLHGVFEIYAANDGH